MSPRQGDRCEICGGEWLVMVAKFDHKFSCSQFPADLRRQIERTRERLGRSGGRETTAAQTKPRRQQPSLPARRRGAVVQDLITGRIYTPEMDEHIERELRGGIGQGHPVGHDCPLCEDNRRRVLRHELAGIPGISPKDEEGIYEP
jgi:hypothetical protein